MNRRLFNLLTALSLLLFAAMLALWNRSHTTSDGVLLTTRAGDLRWLVCRDGRVGVLTVQAWPYPISPRWYRVPERLPQTGPWMALADDWLAYGPPERPGFLSIRSCAGVGQIENKPGGWSDFGNCLHRRYTRGPPNMSYRMTEAPLLPAVGAAAAVPALRALSALRRWARRAGRANLGLCPVCGYDLRATPGRCPECGTETASGGQPVT